MIDRIRLVNFKSHRDTILELGPLTALVGPNGSGKTSVLEAIYYAINREELPGRLQGIDPEKPIAEADAPAQEKLTKVRKWRYKRHDPRPISPDIWMLRANSDSWEEASADLTNDGLAVFNELDAAYLKAFGKSLAKPSYSLQIPPAVSQNGDGLAVVVGYLKMNHDKEFKIVENALQKVVPNILSIRPTLERIPSQRSRKRGVTGFKLTFDTFNAKGIPAEAMSEGTLMALCILTLTANPESPNIILIDDIEQGLHPRAQRELIGQLKKLQEIKPELQIVMTTHSPYIVDELEPEQVWVLATDEEGISHAKRLSEHPQADEWRKVFSTGELWDAQGEDWVLPDAKEPA